MMSRVPFAVLIVLTCACSEEGGEVHDHDASHDAGLDAADLGDGGDAIDTGGAADVDPGCPASGVTADEATRSNDAGSVTVQATLLNALTHCAKDELAFELVFDTHSVDLSAIDVMASSMLETNTGAAVADLRWEPGSVSSHHVDGLLRGAAPPLAGVSWLRLTVRSVAGVDRIFEWDETFLAHDLPR